MFRRTLPTLRQRALEWLAQREHSRQELRDKLARWVQALHATESALPAAAVQRAHEAQGQAPVRRPGPALPTIDEIEPLLDALQAAGHLSDARFVESRVHARAARYGNRRIEHELRQRGVEPPPEVREALRSSELARARSVWARKFEAAPASAAEHARQARFLAGRGFSAETVREVLRGAPEPG
jgi:regulatory protein